MSYRNATEPHELYRVSKKVCHGAVIPMPHFTAPGTFISAHPVSTRLLLLREPSFIRPEPPGKWFWMIFLMGRQKSGISMLSLKRMLEIKGYRTVWIIGHKIRKAMAERDAYYKLAGIVEMDDTYFGAPKSGKRGRGAAGKAKVVVAVETHQDKLGFAIMQRVEPLSGDEISQVLTDRLEENVVSRSDGWRAYRGW